MKRHRINLKSTNWR